MEFALLGTWRFLLASAVALSHAGWRLMGLNPGVVAVVCFYMISGYVMTGLIRSRYPTLACVHRFYLDRILRLYPLYLAVVALTLIWLLWSGEHPVFVTQSISIAGVMQNLAVIPLNFFMFNGVDQFTLIPPAWSLGAEIQFYLIFPFVLAWRLWIGIVSLIVYGLAATGKINSDWFGYRLLPGVLWFFLIGSWLYDRHHKAEHKSSWTTLVVILMVILSSVAMWILGKMGKFSLPYNHETLYGFCIGIILLHTLAQLPRNRWDELLGDLSYGIFLCHFLLLWAVFGEISGWEKMMFFITGATATSWLIQVLVEKPVLRIRERFRPPR